MDNIGCILYFALIGQVISSPHLSQERIFQLDDELTGKSIHFLNGQANTSLKLNVRNVKHPPHARLGKITIISALLSCFLLYESPFVGKNGGCQPMSGSL